MHYDISLRAGVKQRLEALAQEMREWEDIPRFNEDEQEKLLGIIQTFEHTTKREKLRIAGVDGSGDFPSLAYGDSFVYITFAQATCYESHSICGLKEISPTLPPVFEFSWIPEEEKRRIASFDMAFESLMGETIEKVIELSDYRLLKAKYSRKTDTVTSLKEGLIRPHAADFGNIAIQLRSTGELGAALRMLQSDLNPNYLLIDGTLSLPFVNRSENSLLYEHVKRLCCVVSRERGIGFLALSKSSGLPAIEKVEELVRSKFNPSSGKVTEHWFLRIPTKDIDGWETSLSEGRLIPPPGSVTYLVRFHRSTPVFRIDMDKEFWRSKVYSQSPEELLEKEKQIFMDLDYASHDQRCYGYPYPIKAGHDRASLTSSERVVLRKQIIDYAVKQGMKRSLFRDASLATGHE